MAKRLVLQQPHGSLEIVDYSPTNPSGQKILVKNQATSLNHLDWKRIEHNFLIPSFPHVLGVDIAGQVVDAGESMRFKAGDFIVAPGLVGYSEGSSFQTHVLVHEEHCAKLNETVNILEVATLPFSLSTAACGLYVSLGLNQISQCKAEALLIWGASGGVGKLAIQLAKISGYIVIAVTSTVEGMTAAKARGADHIFNNSDPDVVGKILTAAPSLCYAFDTAVAPETIAKISHCCKRPARVATATTYLQGNSDIPGFQLCPVFCGEIMGRTSNGEQSLAGLQTGKWIWENLPLWLTEGRISPLEYEEIDGLEAIEHGLKRMKCGAAKKKLVTYVE